MQLENDFVTPLKRKLQEFLSECSYAEQQGTTFSGEAWAYRRVLNYINSLPIPTSEAAA